MSHVVTALALESDGLGSNLWLRVCYVTLVKLLIPLGALPLSVMVMFMYGLDWATEYSDVTLFWAC